MSTLTAERLKSLLRYDPETGVFTRLRSGFGWLAGRVAGSPNKKGYIAIGVNGEEHYGHRLAWLYMTGEWPADQVDHWDRNKGNNSWKNLRMATDTQNHANSKRYKNNKTGYRGIFLTPAGTWNVKCQGKHVGNFTCLEEAIAARQQASVRTFGEFAPESMDGTGT